MAVLNVHDRLVNIASSAILLEFDNLDWHRMVVFLAGKINANIVLDILLSIDTLLRYIE